MELLPSPSPTCNLVKLQHLRLNPYNQHPNSQFCTSSSCPITMGIQPLNSARPVTPKSSLSPIISCRGGAAHLPPFLTLVLPLQIPACRSLARRYGTQGFSTTTCPIDFKYWNSILLHVLDTLAKF